MRQEQSLRKQINLMERVDCRQPHPDRQFSAVFRAERPLAVGSGFSVRWLPS